jgi:predicted secreted hydrolase
MQRRHLLLAGMGVLPWQTTQAQKPAAAPATEPPPLPRRTLVFPRDFGSHPELRTEWWYITGHLSAGERRFGFQVTFFRTRVDATQGLRSSLAAHHLVLAHAAITDVAGRKLWHDQRIARQGPGQAWASETDTDLRLRDWSLKRSAGANGSQYQTAVSTSEFRLQLRLDETQALLLQGDQGLSRKGPQPSQASYYYSLPQLQASGQLELQGKALAVSGTAWLDHEWSESVLHRDAVGWDWIGMNLFDGSSLTAFRLRRKDGSTLYSGGSFRSKTGSAYICSNGEVEFSVQRRWTSGLSKAVYPVEWMVKTPADFYTVRAVIDDQELDSRNSTGAIYWEGLSELYDSNGKHVGRGYLEMTGYAAPLRL